jgi:3,4-dihydroxy-9,10-secoandrosta-1,3,5(10)-triene-9,17-dione 4,5-dioxygenase
MVEGAGPTPTRLPADGRLPGPLVIVPGERDRLAATGWEVADPAELARLAVRLEEAGVPYKAGTAPTSWPTGGWTS